MFNEDLDSENEDNKEEDEKLIIQSISSFHTDIE